MKSRYYEAELAYLRDQGREFSRAFPNTAGLLAERSDDPDVERLLEGFAFLTSRIRERIDDALPELGQQLCAVLVPQLTRYLPSAAIIQFRPDTRTMRGNQLVARGTQVAGTTPEGVRCLFQTTADTQLLPIAISDVRFERPTSRTDKIVLQLQTSETGLAAAGATPIRLHFHGEISTASTLRSWFTRHCVQISAVANGATLGTLPPTIAPVGFDPNARLLPERPLEHDAFTFVAELFACPSKFSFVDLPPLGNLIRPQFELHFTFERAPKPPRSPSKDDIRLHCVPVVNLFPCPADPIRFRPLQPEAIVRAAEHPTAHAEVYDVVSVIGLSGGGRVNYPSFTSFRSATGRDARYYMTRRVPAVNDSGTDLYLSLASPLDAHPISEAETLSIELLCTNRGLGPSLRLGDLSQPVRSAAALPPFANITPVSPPLYPHDDVELLWRIGAHVGLSRGGLQDADNLRRLLEVYNFAERWNPQLGRLNGMWIDAIREVQPRKLIRLLRGSPVTGTKIIVILDETHFATIGEAILFGDVLNELFARRVAVNSFNQLTVTLSPSRRDVSWPARYGERTVL